jgi:hypothetical protein
MMSATLPIVNLLSWGIHVNGVPDWCVLLLLLCVCRATVKQCLELPGNLQDPG